MKAHLALVAATLLVGATTTAPAEAAPLAAISSSSSSYAATTAYDPKEALRGVFYSKAVKCDAASIASWTCPACKAYPAMTDVAVFTDRDTQAFVGYDGSTKRIVVAVRGSSNTQNWIDDFTFEQVPYELCTAHNTAPCKVHKGFLEVYTALSVDIVPNVQRLLAKHPNAPLFITGHSLGAAITLLAALDLKAVTNSPSITVYNYGEPRVGDAAFAQFAVNFLPSNSQFRITHHKDPVPHLPPRAFGFIHTPHEIFYNNNLSTTGYVICNDSASAEDDSCSDQYGAVDYIKSDHDLYLGVKMGCNATDTAELEMIKKMAQW